MTDPRTQRRCVCPCNEVLPPGAPDRQIYKHGSRCKMRARRRDRANDRRRSAALWADISRRGRALTERRGRMERRPNGARPALTHAAKRFASKA